MLLTALVLVWIAASARAAGPPAGYYDPYAAATGHAGGIYGAAPSYSAPPDPYAPQIPYPPAISPHQAYKGPKKHYREGQKVYVDICPAGQAPILKYGTDHPIKCLPNAYLCPGEGEHTCCIYNEVDYHCCTKKNYTCPYYNVIQASAKRWHLKHKKGQYWHVQDKYILRQDDYAQNGSTSNYFQLDDGSSSQGGMYHSQGPVSGYGYGGQHSSGGHHQQSSYGQQPMHQTYGQASNQYGGHQQMGYGGGHGQTGYGGGYGQSGYGGGHGQTGYGGGHGQTSYGGSHGQTSYGGSHGQRGYGSSHEQAGYGGSHGQTGYGGSHGQAGYGGSHGQTSYGGSHGQTGYGGGHGQMGYGGGHQPTGYGGQQTMGYAPPHHGYPQPYGQHRPVIPYQSTYTNSYQNPYGSHGKSNNSYGNTMNYGKVSVMYPVAKMNYSMTGTKYTRNSTGYENNTYGYGNYGNSYGYGYGGYGYGQGHHMGRYQEGDPYSARHPNPYNMYPYFNTSHSSSGGYGYGYHKNHHTTNTTKTTDITINTTAADPNEKIEIVLDETIKTNQGAQFSKLVDGRDDNIIFGSMASRKRKPAPRLPKMKAGATEDGDDSTHLMKDELMQKWLDYRLEKAEKRLQAAQRRSKAKSKKP